MSQLVAKKMSELNAQEAAALTSSSLAHTAEASYWYSDHEQRFLASYHPEYEADRIDSVLFDGMRPTLLIRGQVRKSHLSFWGRPAKLFLSPDLPPSSLRSAQGLLKKYFRGLGVESMSLVHDDFVTSTFLDDRTATKNEFRGWIDLSGDEAEITGSVRKSYRSLVNWGKKNLSLQTYDAKSISKDEIERMRLFHIAVSGRETRSQRTWEIQGELIRAGAGYLVTATWNEEIVSAILVFHGSEEAVYGVAVNDRSLMADGKPIGHWPLLHAILEAKSRGMKRFDLGPVTSTESSDGDAKEANIAKFKKGFCDRVTVSAAHDFKLKSEDPETAGD